MSKSTARSFAGAEARADSMALRPFPNSRKVYVCGSRPDIRAPFREISLSPTVSDDGARINPPVFVYDTSGPYTDPDAVIDIRSRIAADSPPLD